jgi:hypothetical protein
MGAGTEVAPILAQLKTHTKQRNYQKPYLQPLRATPRQMN